MLYPAELRAHPFIIKQLNLKINLTKEEKWLLLQKLLQKNFPSILKVYIRQILALLTQLRYLRPIFLQDICFQRTIVHTYKFKAI